MREPGDEGQGLAGDRLKSLLEAVGVTEERVSKWVGAPCGCDERRMKLNALDAWVRRTTKKGLGGAKGFLSSIMGEQ